MGWFTPILLQNIILILKGVAMGAANKVPGVSGGIVAFVAVMPTQGPVRLRCVT